MLSQRPSARHHQESSDGTSVFEGLTSGSTDLPSVVFSYAPFWWWSCNWWCKHPDSKEEQSHITIAGPFSSDEMYQLYKNRQMKGSNLVVGLTSNLPAPSKDGVPASFFRTLAYLFEMAKAGVAYTPMSSVDLSKGHPHAGWCRPLWGSQLPAEQQPGRSGPGAPDETSSARPPDLSNLSISSDAGLAEKLLSSAPWWCYLYSHEPAKEPGRETAKAKKTPPKTAEQMLQYYRDRCLPDWTPVLGLDKSVATFNALPPCLFMPLGSLIHLTATGGKYQALNDAELQAWDKFSDSRNPATGSTMGGQGVAGGPPSQPPSRGGPGPLMPRHSVGSQPYTGPSPGGSWPHASHQHQASQPSAFVQYQQSQAPMAYPASQFATAPAPGMMWMVPGGAGYAAPFSSGQMYRQPGPAIMAPPPLSPLDGGPERSSDVGPIRSVERVFRTQLSCPTPAHSTPLSRQESRGLDRPAISNPPAYTSRTSGGRWSTAVFRLFTADATRDGAEAVWWYTAPNDIQVFGPCMDEQMIIYYLRGQISDDHFACGMMADAGTCPPISQFERIGAIMSAVESGGEYHLLSAADLSSLMGPRDGPERFERHSYTGLQGTVDAARRRGRAPAPMPRPAPGFGVRVFGGSADQAGGRW